MKSCAFLGYASGMIPTLFDQVHDVHSIDSFDIYLNMEIMTLPELPLFEYDYTIHPVGTKPHNSDILLFGTSGPRNKHSLFTYFETQHSIEKTDYSRLIHPSAYISRSSISSISTATTIEQMVIIESQTQIGFGVNIKRGSAVGHHNILGDYVDINPGVVTSGKVSIGRGTILGTGTVVKDNIQIGSNSYIGAGSVVVKDIPNGVIAYGNPCKVVRENDKWQI